MNLYDNDNIQHNQEQHINLKLLSLTPVLSRHSPRLSYRKSRSISVGIVGRDQEMMLCMMIYVGRYLYREFYFVYRVDSFAGYIAKLIAAYINIIYIIYSRDQVR